MRAVSAFLLCLAVFSATLTSWVQASWPTTVPEAIVFTVALAWAFAGLVGLVRLKAHILMIPLALILVWAGIQIGLGTTSYVWRTKVAMLYWGCNLATFSVALQIFASSRARDVMLQALVWFGVLLAILSPVQQIYGGDKVLWFFQPFPDFVPQFGPFPYRNQYAAFIELLIPIPLYRAMTDERARMVNVTAAAIMYASVIAAASRMGFILASLEMLIVPSVLYFRGRLRARSMRNNVLLFGAVFVMLVVAAGPAEMLKKFRVPDPYAGRREYSQSSIQMIRERPLMGFGVGNWATVYPGYALFDDTLRVNQAHDDWVQWAAEGGIPLLAIMLWIAVWAMPRAISSGWGTGVAAIFLHCFVDYPIQRTPAALVMMILLAALASSQLRVSGTD